MNEGDRRVDERTERAAVTLARWRLDPVTMVLEEFGTEPDPWQTEALRAFPHEPRIALVACKGPGKSTLLAWCILNFVSTRPYSKVACTSITGDNLRDCLWAELGKWRGKSKFLQSMFDLQNQRMSYRHDPENWFVSARKWSREADQEAQEATLAGLHADYILVVVDEASGVPDSVVNSGEGALSTGKECHLIIAGNPILAEGPLYRAARIDRALWKVFEITGDPDDPNRAPRVNIVWARQMIEKYGRDNPWVQSDILGKFPTSTATGLVSLDAVYSSFGRVVGKDGLPLLRGRKAVGFDVARRGTSLNCLTFRDGDFIERQKAWHEPDTTQSAASAREQTREYGARVLYVDDIGVGGGAVDQLNLLEREVVDPARRIQIVPVNVSLPPTGAGDEFHTNIRSELAGVIQGRFRDQRISFDPSMRSDSMELCAQLTGIRYSFNSKGKRILEVKDDFKRRTGTSPDQYDSLALVEADDILGQGGFASSEDGDDARASGEGLALQGRRDPYADDEEPDRRRLRLRH